VVKELDSQIRPDVDTSNPIYQFWALLNTKRGTVPLFRDVGIDARIVDKPINIIENVIQAELTQQVKKYIPEIEIISISSQYIETGLSIKAKIEVIT